MSLISIVVPCYNEEESLPLFYQAILEMKSSLPEVDFEFIFVNDGSKDNTLKIMRSLAQQDANVHYVSFSRNFGKEAALLAGLAHAQGDYVAVMDADLQDPPALLPEMYETLQTKMYDCVATRRVTREGEPPQNRNCGWCARFSFDDTSNGKCNFVCSGIQPIFERHFRLGGIPYKMA